MTTVPTNPENTCPTYSWCREPLGHEFHASKAAILPFAEAFLMAEDGRDGDPGLDPFIGIGEFDLTPEQAHDMAARIREFADQVDAMATTAEAAGLDDVLVLDGDPDQPVPYVPADDAEDGGRP